MKKSLVGLLLLTLILVACTGVASANQPIEAQPGFIQRVYQFLIDAPRSIVGLFSGWKTEVKISSPSVATSTGSKVVATTTKDRSVEPEKVVKTSPPPSQPVSVPPPINPTPVVTNPPPVTPVVVPPVPETPEPGMEVYTNDKFGFQFQRPSAWKIQEVPWSHFTVNPDGLSLYLCENSIPCPNTSPGVARNIYFSVWSTQKGEGLYQIVFQGDTGWPSTYYPWGMSRADVAAKCTTGSRTVAGHTAKTWLCPTNFIAMWERNPGDSYFYILNIPNLDTQPDRKAIYEKILSSFKFTK